MSKFRIYGEAISSRLETKGNPTLHTVYGHQWQAVLKTRKMFLEDMGKRSLAGKRNDEEAFRPMAIVSPTGSGKSGMIVMLPYVLEAKKVLILTPSLVISEQIAKSFGKGLNNPSFLELTGVIKPGERGDMLELPRIMQNKTDMDDLANLIIVNAQKFAGRSGTTLSLLYRDKEVVKDVEKFFSIFDLLIVDEAHHYPAPTWKNIVETFSKPVKGLQKKIVFLTATPYRTGKDGKHVPILPDLLERIAYTISRNDLEEGKFIRTTRFEEKPDPSTLPEDIKAYFESESVRKLPFKAQAMIIVPTIKEAQECEKLLNSKEKEKYAVAIFRSTGKVKINSKKLIDDFTKGRYRVAIVCGLHKEGYDNSKVTLCVILRKIGKKLLFTQFVGRCMRVYEPPSSASSPSKRARMETPAQEGVILSYKKFKQQKMWQEREMLSEQDPVDVDLLGGIDNRSVIAIPGDGRGFHSDVVKVEPLSDQEFDEDEENGVVALPLIKHRQSSALCVDIV